MADAPKEAALYFAWKHVAENAALLATLARQNSADATIQQKEAGRRLWENHLARFRESLHTLDTLRNTPS